MQNQRILLQSIEIQFQNQLCAVFRHQFARESENIREDVIRISGNRDEMRKLFLHRCVLLQFEKSQHFDEIEKSQTFAELLRLEKCNKIQI